MKKIQKYITETSKFAFVSIAILFCFLRAADARDVTLAWNFDPTVDGYKIYYKPGFSGPVYDGTGAIEGDSPIDVGRDDKFSLRALSDDEDYYFVITAYNEYGESGYSTEVTTAKNVAGSTFTAAGGGGGCFISALRGGNEE